MRFDAVRFHKQLEISGLAASDRFVIKASEGFALERDDLGNGIIARHPSLKMPLWLPAAIIASADIIEIETELDREIAEGSLSEAELQETLAEVTRNNSARADPTERKRGPGRPKKVA